jgi:hypothetical protein
LDRSEGANTEAMIKRLNSKSAKILTSILTSPTERLVWRDWISYWKSVRVATNLGVGLIWRGSYRNRGYFSRRLALTLITVKL